MKRSSLILVCVSCLWGIANVHAALEGYQHVSPAPGSLMNTCQSSIIIREGSPIDQSSLQSGLIRVTGTKSGAVDGRIVLSTDGKTILFQPDQAFLPNESVQVWIEPGIRTRAHNTLPAAHFSFQTGDLDLAKINHMAPESARTHSVNTPQVSTVIYDSSAIGDGKILLSWYGQLGLVFKGDPSLDAYIMVLNNDGSPYYQKNIGSTQGVGLVDFKMQPNGYFSYPKVLSSYQWTGGGAVKHIVLDNHFAVVDSFQMGNGYTAETHDFRLLANGHALLMAYYLLPVDLSKLVAGGHPNAWVDGAVVQELDADKNVIFQWRTWDYFDVKQIPWAMVQGATQQIVNVFHLNAISMDHDGNLLLGTPGMGLKVNRQTGAVMWIIGGFMNQFTFAGVPPLEGAGDFGGHTFERLANGNVMVYDNSPFPWQPGANTISAEAVEYRLDEVNRVAELVWKYIPAQFTPGWHAGSVQRLDNGNAVIGWGGPTGLSKSLVMSEVTASGAKVMDVFFESGEFESYRAFRVVIDGAEPAITATRTEVAPGNIYTFTSVDSAETGVRMKVNSYFGSGYNELTVKTYDFAPLAPEFFGKAPRVLPARAMVSSFAIANFQGDIRFNTSAWHISNPAVTLIYQREYENRGLFLPLETTYNHVTGEVTAAITGLGEFILAEPDLDAVVFTPRLDAPADSARVNQELPVTLRWAPVGFVSGYQLQISRDAAFTDKVVDEPMITNAVYNFAAAANTTYFWRVKSVNEAGVSEWTRVYSFTTVPAMVRVISPNGGEKWQRGLPYYIRWQCNFPDPVVLMLSTSAGVSSIIDTVANTFSFNWEISPKLAPGAYKIMIKHIHRDALADSSDAAFSVIDTTASRVAAADKPAGQYALHQNYPNPFNPVTAIRFDLLKSEQATLIVYDVTGREVARLQDGLLPAGAHTVRFDGSRLTTGMYLYKIETPSFTQMRKMMLLK